MDAHHSLLVVMLSGGKGYACTSFRTALAVAYPGVM